MDILGYEFEKFFGFHNTNQLKNQSGVYVILGIDNTSKLVILDVGESLDVKERIENHDRKSCWKLQRCSEVSVAVHYTEGFSREVIEKEIREKYNPPCGER